MPARLDVCDLRRLPHRHSFLALLPREKAIPNRALCHSRDADGAPEPASDSGAPGRVSPASCAG
ncbi:hypothetical protein GCM10020218_025910 [Dactylosporangium vinaceum]